ncbi:MAG: hypothetical protein ACLPVF_03165 [Acidimicrobiales bacterium]
MTTDLTVTPNDAAKALRMGWSVAEVRGRFDPLSGQSADPDPPPPALLLSEADERSAVECQVESVKVLSSLAHGGTTDFTMSEITFKVGWFPPKVPMPRASGMLTYIAARLIWARTDQDLTGTLGSVPIDPGTTRDPEFWWDRLLWFLWAWDEAIYDQFATQNFGTASSYELGRGLAESYWALHPDETSNRAASWSFLLGTRRVAALSDLCRRLAPVIGVLTAAAVEASLRAWGTIAAQPGDYTRPVDSLRQQIKIWRDLLVTGREPLSLVDTSELAAVARRPWPFVRAFGWELAVGLVGALAIGLAVTFLKSFSATVLSVLGAVGITGSALIGWAKTSAQSVGRRVGDEVNQKVVIEAVECLPEPAAGVRRTGVLMPRRDIP